jgi:iron-sulfur cluster repair protein YtfE (RIC family)
MSVLEHQPVSVIETAMTHRMHRLATSLLAEAATRPSAPLTGLDELRVFLVKTLHHHHESEDNVLWPMITASAPEISDSLTQLSTEHDELDAALDLLESLPVRQDGDRAALRNAAVVVRDVVHLHLEHEEPLLFPALRAHVTPQAWTEFSQHVIATSPPDGAHLLIALFDQVGSTEEVEMILSSLPEPARAFVPAMREQGQAALAALQAAG